MQSYTESSRVHRRIPVGLRLTGSETAETYSTDEIGDDTLSIEGAPNLRPGQVVELTFEAHNGHNVMINCVAVAHSGSKLLVYFGDLQHEMRERLEQAIWPAWDGSSLLDGLILLAGRYGDATLKDWLRLTNLLAGMQPRLVHRRYAQAPA